ncbi:hypothetical protein [Natronomonas gomsonensis]|uniref:hypothetical protein n=1 Tax=Natronomonas gomsonensis TaxID=1046043 RepID=UPI0015C1651B|nr:hypothetical protein [Natronomonas gomsonensis]
MTRRRRLLLAAALLASVVVVTTTGGFSSATAERGVDVSVAEDSNAYLGVEQAPSGTENGTTNLEVTVANQFPAGTDLTTVEVTANGTTVDFAEPDAVEAGDERTYTFRTVSCDGRITVEAQGAGVTVGLNRTVACG